jgi:hypothetical protein
VLVVIVVGPGLLQRREARPERAAECEHDDSLCKVFLAESMVISQPAGKSWISTPINMKTS